ncbi:MAG: hypothetical protein IMW98_04470 [Firmicutes bacterium]|nr:hypothetical protein [Bacillota bacterium]
MVYFFSPVTGFGTRLGYDFFAAPRLAIYGFLAYLALSGSPQGVRIVGWILWTLLAAALGFNRRVLSDHWPKQVLAGYASGACILIGMATGAKRILQTRRTIPTAFGS